MCVPNTMSGQDISETGITNSLNMSFIVTFNTLVSPDLTLIIQIVAAQSSSRSLFFCRSVCPLVGPPLQKSNFYTLSAKCQVLIAATKIYLPTIPTYQCESSDSSERSDSSYSSDSSDQ